MWFQQKFDGRRLAVQKSEENIQASTNSPNHSIDSRLAESLDRVKAHGFLADGESLIRASTSGTCSV